MRFIINLGIVSILSLFISLVSAEGIKSKVDKLVKEELKGQLESIKTDGSAALEETSSKLGNVLGEEATVADANEEQ